MIWTSEAIANLNNIFRYIAGFNPSAAARLAQRLQTAANSLIDHPERGAPLRAGYANWPQSIPI